MFSINHKLSVDAPTETVWNVISDLDAYGEWNPFVVACRSSLEVNSPINMKVRVLPFFAIPQKETIFEHDPQKKLSYGISLPFDALKSYRSHEVKTTDSGATEYISTFELSGWLSPLVKWMLEKNLQNGFTGMSDGIQARSQRLALKQ